MDRSQLIPTEVVGSYPQPNWLVDRDNLRGRPPPRIKANDIWRVDSRFLKQAQDDATLLAIREMELAGVDVISDGEIRRESYSVTFATSLEGMDSDHPGEIVGRSGRKVLVPRVVGPVKWNGPILVSDAEFLRRNSRKKVKVTIPGPFTITQQAKNDYYEDETGFALDVATAVNQEARAVQRTGIDVIQLDEPYLQTAPEKAKLCAVEAINRAVEGLNCRTALHTCFGYGFIIKSKPKGYPFLEELNECRVQQISLESAQPDLDPGLFAGIDKTIMLGVLNLADTRVETPAEVRARGKRALRHIPPERLILGPDCGMKYLDKDVAFGKLKAMVEGARDLRAGIF